MKNNNYCKRLLAGILAVVLILSVTACDTRQKIYNNYTMHTVTSFGFTDDGKARVSVDYTGYRDTKGADIDVTIEKQGFLFFWEKVVTEHYTIEEESYQHEYFYDIDDDGTYRCTVVYTVFGSGENDVITFKDTKDYRANDMITETTDTSTVQTTTAETSTTETTTAETTTETTTEEMTTTVQTEPPESEEEKERRLRYEAAVEALNAYLETGEPNNEMLKYLYTEFSELGDYEDSERYLEHFTLLPDMLTEITSVTTDANGNTKEKQVGGYSYNQNGQITSAFGEEMLKTYNISDKYMHHFIYDEEGKLFVIDILYTKNDETYREAKLFAEYDENGKLVRLAEESHKSPETPYGTLIYSTTNTRAYSIGENGKVVFINIENPSLPSNIKTPYSGKKTYSSVYSDSGELIRTEAKTSANGFSGHLFTDKYQETETWYYKNKYDENGNLIQIIETWNFHSIYQFYVYEGIKSVFSYPGGGTHFYPNYVLNTTETQNNNKITKNFTYDKNGRIISAEIIDDSKENITEYQTYHYETLYFYTEE